ncbi:hypothetical protein AAMO2058_001662600 [Amorphochlora amoebiformis]
MVNSALGIDSFIGCGIGTYNRRDETTIYVKSLNDDHKDGFRKLGDELKGRRNVLVYYTVKKGASSALALIIAYVMKTERKRLAEVMEILTKRICVNTNTLPLYYDLQRYDEKLFGNRTKHTPHRVSPKYVDSYGLQRTPGTHDLRKRRKTPKHREVKSDSKILYWHRGIQGVNSPVFKNASGVTTPTSSPQPKVLDPRKPRKTPTIQIQSKKATTGDDYGTFATTPPSAPASVTPDRSGVGTGSSGLPPAFRLGELLDEHIPEEKEMGGWKDDCPSRTEEKSKPRPPDPPVGFASETYAEVEIKAPGKMSKVIIQTRDQNGEPMKSGKYSYTVTVRDSKNKEEIPISLIALSSGRYMGYIQIPKKDQGHYEIHILLQGKHLKNSPLTVVVANGEAALVDNPRKISTPQTSKPVSEIKYPSRSAKDQLAQINNTAETGEERSKPAKTEFIPLKSSSSKKARKLSSTDKAIQKRIREYNRREIEKNNGLVNKAKQKELERKKKSFLGKKKQQKKLEDAEKRREVMLSFKKAHLHQPTSKASKFSRSSAGTQKTPRNPGKTVSPKYSSNLKAKLRESYGKKKASMSFASGSYVAPAPDDQNDAPVGKDPKWLTKSGQTPASKVPSSAEEEMEDGPPSMFSPLNPHSSRVPEDLEAKTAPVTPATAPEEEPLGQPTAKKRFASLGVAPKNEDVLGEEPEGKVGTGTLEAAPKDENAWKEPEAKAWSLGGGPEDEDASLEPAEAGSLGAASRDDEARSKTKGEAESLEAARKDGEANQNAEIKGKAWPMRAAPKDEDALGKPEANAGSRSQVAGPGDEDAPLEPEKEEGAGPLGAANKDYEVRSKTKAEAESLKSAPKGGEANEAAEVRGMVDPTGATPKDDDALGEPEDTKARSRSRGVGPEDEDAPLKPDMKAGAWSPGVATKDYEVRSKTKAEAESLESAPKDGEANETAEVKGRAGPMGATPKDEDDMKAGAWSPGVATKDYEFRSKTKVEAESQQSAPKNGKPSKTAEVKGKAGPTGAAPKDEDAQGEYEAKAEACSFEAALQDDEGIENAHTKAGFGSLEAALQDVEGIGKAQTRAKAGSPQAAPQDDECIAQTKAEAGSPEAAPQDVEGIGNSQIRVKAGSLEAAPKHNEGIGTAETKAKAGRMEIVSRNQNGRGESVAGSAKSTRGIEDASWNGRGFRSARATTESNPRNDNGFPADGELKSGDVASRSVPRINAQNIELLSVKDPFVGNVEGEQKREANAPEEENQESEAGVADGTEEAEKQALHRVTKRLPEGLGTSAEEQDKKKRERFLESVVGRKGTKASRRDADKEPEDEAASNYLANPTSRPPLQSPTIFNPTSNTNPTPTPTSTPTSTPWINPSSPTPVPGPISLAKQDENSLGNLPEKSLQNRPEKSLQPHQPPSTQGEGVEAQADKPGTNKSISEETLLAEGKKGASSAEGEEGEGKGRREGESKIAGNDELGKNEETNISPRVGVREGKKEGSLTKGAVGGGRARKMSVDQKKANKRIRDYIKKQEEKNRSEAEKVPNKLKMLQKKRQQIAEQKQIEKLEKAKLNREQEQKKRLEKAREQLSKSKNNLKPKEEDVSTVITPNFNPTLTVTSNNTVCYDLKQHYSPTMWRSQCPRTKTC